MADLTAVLRHDALVLVDRLEAQLALVHQALAVSDPDLLRDAAHQLELRSQQLANLVTPDDWTPEEEPRG